MALLGGLLCVARVLLGDVTMVLLGVARWLLGCCYGVARCC